MIPRFLFFCIGSLCILFNTSFAQAPKKLSASEVQLALKKLNVLGSALYVAAHPDDENQVVIGYMSQVELLNTGYLSLTRGDGGQNLIGSEIRERLGVVRTQELIQARSVDGSQQFFTRAIDFGYSKTSDETLKLWEREKILSDVVWVIRQFRPDVIITRFPPDSRAGHGHHTTSGILAAEAFDLAGDPDQFSNQLEYVEAWQPTRLMLNETSWFTSKIDSIATANDSVLVVDMGVYLPLLGKSVPEIASLSRSKHESQGFGSTGVRGQRVEYFRHVKGKMAKDHPLDNIPTSWSRLEGGAVVGELLQQAYQNYNPEQPSAIVPTLLQAYEALNKLPEGYWKQVKAKELTTVIQACLGLYAEVRSGTNALVRRFRGAQTRPDIAEYSATPGDSITLNFEVIQRNPQVEVQLNKIEVAQIGYDTLISNALEDNALVAFNKQVKLPDSLPYTEPYWLRAKNDGFTFSVDDQMLIGRDETPPALEAAFSFTVNGQALNLTSPVIYKRNDPRKGEMYRPFVIIPPVLVSLPENVYVFASAESQTVTATVEAGHSNVQGNVSLKVPSGWSVSPAQYNYAIALKGQEQEFTFTVTPPTGASTGKVQVMAEYKEQSYQQSMVTIDYEHIPTQTLLPLATANLVKLDIRKEGNLVGYVMGAGDDVPKALKQIGYEVALLEEEDIRMPYLSNFDAIIIGIRAYNTVNWLRYRNDRLLEYVEQGGTLITQYNTSSRLVMQDFSPYSLQMSRDRVSDETAEVRILAPSHPVLNTPNEITVNDFQGWVQERGLYFPNEWDEKFTPILSMNDPGEEEKKGSLLVAPYGKGHYIYTGISFFRELPAGVPGAYRLLTNLISVGKDEQIERGNE
ncbi:PIG-L family deacetylase [Tunicatimonas pelagia]|uniref:PIG-L family deacetylase n=1 Tax=Tunicatimonas pelagia TaxID=931531 RepID=UPI0026669CD7|nr:PIG-L family deacetylase [Tunicatimonas pelagia]WKN42958.1 PIG-L family deacetylase [Tunicatimonas pelagia]